MQPVPQHSCGSGRLGGWGLLMAGEVWINASFTPTFYENAALVDAPRLGRQLLDKRFFAFLANCRQRDHDQQDQRNRQQ